MGEVCKLAGVKCHIIFTSMDQPIGFKVGKWLEVEETIDSLAGNYPADVRLLTIELASAMLCSAGLFANKNDAKAEIIKVWDNGTALANFYKMIEAQGGDINKSRTKHKEVLSVEVKADKTGYIFQIDTLYTGIAGIISGAGRRTVEDIIDYSAGLIFNKKIGDSVVEGETIVKVQGRDKYKINEAADFIRNCIQIADAQVSSPKLIIDELIF